MPARPDLTAPGHDHINVVGDTALAQDACGMPLPAIAPVAKQQGAHLARSILARIAGRAAHIYITVSMRNRLIVMTQWRWSYFRFERGARLITGMLSRR